MRSDSAISQASRYGLVAFFALALGITWLLQLPALLAHLGIIGGKVDDYMLPAALGGFGPVIAAALATRMEARLTGVRRPWGLRRNWRVSPGWYLTAFVAFGVIHVAGSAVYRLLGGHDPGAWLYLPNAQQAVVMFLIPLAEEPGWRGFALPRLHGRMGVFRASIMLGILWCAWHIPMFVLQGYGTVIFVTAFVNLIAASVVFSWLFERTGGSVLVAVVAHMGAHLDNTNHALPGNPIPLIVFSVATVAAAIAVVVLDRSVRWFAPPAVPESA